MLKLAPNLIQQLTSGQRVTLVSATNGKSTTTRLLAAALATQGQVAHNSTGANMAPGVASALAATRGAKLAALEVDEAHLPKLAQATGAEQLVLMNLSRDQLDRGSEVKMLAQRWRAMAQQLGQGTLVIANADDPVVAWAAGAAPNVLWVGGGQWWTEDSALCPACSQPLDRTAGWHCPGCGLTRPETVWGLSDDAAGLVTPEGQFPANLSLPGRFNVGNAAMALAAAHGMGVPIDAALKAFAQVTDVDGRYVVAQVKGHPVRLLLGKNPASWTEMLGVVGANTSLCTVLNARGADGRDPSWIWDVPFESLATRRSWVAGERRYDLAVRLDTAGVEVAGVSLDPLAALDGLPKDQALDVVANYTAFQELRARVVS
jgi:UDP-N-acetylmuramyl tripeptide synthase